MLKIKQGDKLPITFTVNHDLTAATIRLLVRHGERDGVLAELPHTVEDAAGGKIVHDIDGTWAIGRHYLEVEITQGAEIRTAPSDDFYLIRIVPDLD